MFLIPLLLPIIAAAGSQNPSYLPSIKARWDASDLVCIGEADSPHRTGVAQFINGSNRDQLSATVELERCFKGEMPGLPNIRVLGDYVAAAKPDDGGVISFAYSGPPTGFVHNGRNLLFLRRTSVLDEFLITIPIYETAIPLANVQPTYPSSTSPNFIKTVVTRELENAMLQSEDTAHAMNIQPFADPLLSDYRYIDYLFDYLGTADAASELSRFFEVAPAAIQRDIAMRLFDLGEEPASVDQGRYESLVISLLLDESAPAWKRGNAALVLGRHGTIAALEPLQRVVSHPPQTDQQKVLHNEAVSSLESLEHRIASN